jgi:polar amino acid transport system substrate-binding protein
VKQRRIAGPIVAAVAAVSVLAVPAAAATSAPTTTTTAPANCGDATASFAPQGPLPAPGNMPAGTAMADIQTRKLKVGVDETTKGFSSRDPDSGEMVGFEVDLAKAIGRAIFGADGHVTFVTVTTPQKIPKVTDGTVDMTISVVSMECSRWNQVDFSTAYYNAEQGLLVRADSGIHGLADLAGKRVCVTSGSSSANFLANNAKEAKPVAVDTRTACLVKLQDDRIDAILLPTSILAGFRFQDPTTEMRPLVDENGQPSPNYYGIAINKKHPDLVRYVNGLLDQWRADGTLARLQAQPLGEAGLPVSVPAPHYGREP